MMPSGLNPCSTKDCGDHKYCNIDKYGNAMCSCREYCPPVVIPVCGSDFNTYHSRCHLEKHACHQGKNITIQFIAGCGEYLIYTVLQLTI